MSEIVTPIEILPAHVGLVTMDAIMLHKMVENNDVDIAKQKAVLQKGMEELDCVELSQAWYHYEKAVGILGDKTYLR